MPSVYCILPDKDSRQLFGRRQCSQNHRHHLQVSHCLRSHHSSVQEFILSVSEEQHLGDAVSDECEMKGFKANDLLPGRLFWQETTELSDFLHNSLLLSLQPFLIWFGQWFIFLGCNIINEAPFQGTVFTDPPYQTWRHISGGVYSLCLSLQSDWHESHNYNIW